MENILTKLDTVFRQHSNLTAVFSNEGSYTYDQFDCLVNGISLQINKQGINQGDTVAIYFDSTLLAVATIVALYKQGCAYLPLDPVYPQERINFMVDNAAIRWVLSDKQDINFNSASVVSIIKNEINLEKQLDKTPFPDGENNPNQLGYLIYTSGSTGQPKGVRMPRTVLDNLISWQLAQIGFEKPAATAQFSALSFDVSFQEIFTTFCSGGCLYLIDSDIKQDFRALSTFIIEQNIQRIFMPYIAVVNLIEWSNRLQQWPTNLETIITAGEQLIIDEQMRQFCKKTRVSLINQYGPSESHVVTQYQMPANVENWENVPPIGRPIDGADIFLLDANNKVINEVDHEGEVYITGPVLADGYVNNAKETQEKFVKIQLGGELVKAYKTGDMGKWREDWELLYTGRADNQVKINGYRVELGEIESKLIAHQAISAAAVVVQGKAAANKTLYAFVTTHSQEATDLDKIKSWLAKDLPAYMIPKKIIAVEAFSKTPSGKIDRKQMLEQLLQQEDVQRKDSVQPAEKGNLRPLIIKILTEELGKNFSENDNLIDLGMDSLAANRIVAKFYDELNLDVPAYRLFQHQDIKSLLNNITVLQNSAETTKYQRVNNEPDAGHDIAIIGIGLRVPEADNIQQFWDNLLNEKESVAFFNNSNASDPKINARGVLSEPSGFDAGFFKITPAEAEFIDPQQRVMLELAEHALQDAGCVAEQFNGRVGVFCGVGNNSYYLNNVLKNQDKLNDFGALQAMVANEKDYTATRISHKLNLKGPSVNVLTACSTSLVAVCQAVESLRSGACDIALAGAASITYPQQQPYEYQEGGIFSRDGHTRTFDKNSSGTVFSDGAGIVVLKRLDYAKNDLDNIYAVIKGVALNNDGAEKGSFSAPSIEGQKNVIISALLDADISAEAVGYVEAHGTATPLGDPIEVEALGEAYKVTTDKKQYCGLGSVKSNLGHLTAAAGVVGLIKSALAVKNNYIPASINFSEPNAALKIEKTPFYINSKGKKWSHEDETRIAGISSFGIGGTNAHVIIESIQAAQPVEREPSGLLMPVCMSAKSSSALMGYIQRYSEYFTSNPSVSLMDTAYSSCSFRQDFAYRTSFAASDATMAIQQLNKIARTIKGKKPFHSQNLGFMFPGQGTQTLGMGRYLYAHLADFKKYFDACADILNTQHQLDIKHIIFNDATALQETVNAQPAIFSVSYAMAKVLQNVGVEPGFSLGHSIGELASAAIAGVFDLQTAIQVVVTRAQVMQAQPAGDMIAATASADVLTAYTTDEVVIAADNTPEVCTMSGPAEAVAVVMEKLQQDNIECKLLKTSHAFHSPLMAGAEQALINSLQNIDLQPPGIPFISCVTGDWITDAQATDIRYWAQQIVSPVQFRKAVETIAQLDDVLLIEVGARKVISGLCLQNLSEKNDVRYMQTLPSPSDELDELRGFANALGQLWEYGVNINWSILFNDLKPQRVPIPNYPFQHKNFFVEPAETTVVNTAIPQNPFINSLLVENAQPVVTNETISENINDMNDSLLDKLKLLFSDSSGLELDEVDENANFFELGLDSLFLTQASLQLKKEFKVKITFRQLLNECNSFSKLSDFLKQAGVVEGPKPAVETEQGIPASAVPTAQQVVPPIMPIATQNVEGSSGLTNLFAQQMQLINSQMQLLSQSMSGQTQPITGSTTSPAVTATQSVENSTASSKPEASRMPFGASVRINVKRSNEMTAEQEKYLQELTTRYTEKLKKSKAFAQENRKQLADPRVVSGFRNVLKELIFPVVVERSKGAHLWDIDDNKYVDITCGFGSNFFGNGAEFIRKAIAEQLEKGYEIGPQHPLVAEVSKMFCEQTNSDRVAFCNTGSEAVIGALRLARTVTAKDKVVMFENDYHGINDEVIVSRGRNGQSIAAAAGIPSEAVSNAIILDYGDEKSLQYIEENADEIAAILVEPVQSRYPELQPKEFLQKLRNICSKGDMALIFDEVITGLRIHPNGAQGYYDIQSDIATYGKIIGGGLPIGVIAGKNQFMDALDGGQWQFGDDSAPEVGVTYFAGTFVRHPLALAAANAVLLYLRENPGIQNQMNAKTTAMTDQLNEYCKKRGAPIKIPNCGSLFKIKIPQDIPYEELFYVLMREKGIHIWDARPCFLTTAHSDEDIQYFINAFKESVDEMQAIGFLPKEMQAEEVVTQEFNADAPPAPGAKLGKKPNGDPAWFIEDKERAGKYKILELK